MNVSQLLLLCSMAPLAMLGCRSARNAPGPPPIALDGPAEWEMGQRSSMALPGSDGRILVTIDDITAGRVKVAVSWSDGPSILGERYMRTDDVTTFTLSGRAYRLKLLDLKNVLVGEDRARFEIAPRGGGSGSH